MPKENGQMKPQKQNPKGQRSVGEGKDKKNTEFQWKRAGKTSFIWVFILITAIFLSGLFTSGNQKAIEIQYYQYREFLEQKLIEKAEELEKKTGFNEYLQSFKDRNFISNNLSCFKSFF